MSSSVREKLIGYLSAGVSQAIAAQAAGVSESYVSQLVELPEVREAIALKKSVRLDSALDIDETIEAGEKLALQQMVRKLKSPLVPLKEAAQAFSILNAARKKADAGATGNGAGTVDTVTFILPKAAKIMVQINTDNQIIEVNGKTTAPLPSKVLPQIQKQLELESRVRDMTLRPELPHVTEVKEKVRVIDEKRATQVLRDITTTIDGVQVVI